MDSEILRINPFGLLLKPKGLKNSVYDLDVDMLRELVWKEQIVVLRGFRTFKHLEEFPDYCERLGQISIWPFGKVLELLEQENPEDHIFHNNYVPLHWDGMYRPQVPEFQVFHCVTAPEQGKGGRTTFSNTLLALKNASAETKSLWEKTTVTYQRKMEFYDSKIVSPIVTTHPQKGFSVIRYNEPPDDSHGHFVNPPIIEFSGVNQQEITEIKHSLQKSLYSKNNFYAHEWQQGDIVITDNYSLLHGRESFISKSPRYLRRVHILGTPPLENPALVSHK